MIFVQPPKLTSLINQYRQKDYTLWQILNAIANSTSDLTDQFNQLRTAFNFSMRLEVPVLATGVDKCLAAHRLTLPRDESNNLVYTKVIPKLVLLTAQISPHGADFVGDLQYSHNLFDFTSMFKTTTTMVLPDGAVFAQYGEFSVGTLSDQDLIILNISDIGITTQGLEVTILGMMLP